MLLEEKTDRYRNYRRKSAMAGITQKLNSEKLAIAETEQVSADMVFRINYSFSDDTVKNIYF